MRTDLCIYILYSVLSGIDLFYTHVTPSGTFDLLNPDFNYIALFGTVSAVVAVLLVTNNLANKARLGMLWN